jgi:hypothetical protein
MKKSPIDELFFELYGYYPNKSGQSFEMIVAAALKLLYNKDISYDQRIRGDFSETVYQLDGVVNDDSNKSMIEAKDYTIDDQKVGRGDMQKLQGALTDLSVDKGIFASATDFTKPAKKYAESSSENPMQKPIELLHIRPSTEKDETGRIKRIVIKMRMNVPDYGNSKMNFIWTKEGAEELQKDGHANKLVSMSVDKFYDKDGNTLITIHDLTKLHSPGTTFEKGFISKGCWIIRGYLNFESKLFSIRGIEYEVPFRVSEDEIVIESEGQPKLFIKNEDGTIDKLITDKDLKKVKFNNGTIDIEP